MSVDTPPARPPLARTVAVAQLALALAFLAVGVLWLARMTVAEVGPAEMRTGAYDPKDLVPFGMHGWNPFMWLYGLTAMLFLAGLASPLLAGYGALLLARDRRALSGALRALLLVGVLAGLVVTVLRFTPAGADMQAWWLD